MARPGGFIARAPLLLGRALERTAREAGPRAPPQPALGTTERPQASTLT